MNRLSFGTSAAPAPNNKISVHPDGTIELYSHKDGGSNAGKIAGSEDGITFYFKEVEADKNFRLTADVEVVFFGLREGRTELNGQEGFGLMARDYVPQYPGKTMSDLKSVSPDDDYYAGSTGGTGNMIMAGGVKRGVRAYWRSGVTDPAGECVYDPDPAKIADASKSVFDFEPRELPDYSLYPTMNDRPDFPSAGKKYTLSLEKTNSGFKVGITPPADKGVVPDGKGGVILGQKYEYFVPEPDLLTVINKEHYYVGFFAARSAQVKITNVHYEEAGIEDCAPRIEPESVIFTHSLTVRSPSTASAAPYIFSARANVEGILSVSVNGSVLNEELGRGEWIFEKSNASAVPFTLFEIPVTNLVNGDNVFKMIFYPDKHQNKSKYILASTDPVPVSFIVNKNTYGEGEDIYVSPDGRRTNKGTRDSPLDLETAIAYVNPGKAVIMMDGIYTPVSVVIPRYNNGTADQMKTLKAENRDRAIIDFQGNPLNKGFELRGNYWKISGIHVRGTAPVKRKGLTVMGSYNVVEWVKTYNNGDTGLQISGESAEPKVFWPSHNTVSYCESFNNKDEAKEDADGFAAKLTVGEGNRFEWCAAHHNCDDGWDLFSKKETGTIGVVVIENSIAYRNGYFFGTDGSGEPEYANSGGNGFKMGGEGLSVKHIIKNSLAFMNGADGFTSNSNPALRIENSTAFDNQDRGFAVYGSGTSDPSELDARVTRILSIYSEGNHSNDGVWWDTPDTNPGYVWRNQGCRNKAEAVLTIDNNIVSVSLPFVDAAPFDPSIKGKFVPRHADGTFILNGFLKTKNINGAQPGASNLHTADEAAVD
ncbi:MAG: right-handed parallel beta-helix repeat-containing protein [Treponema sp.]|nr:right-handed parallel beta-helix repeat-containing protein [Treponema sp.]